MPLPRISYLYKRTSEWPHSPAAYFLRATPCAFLLLGIVLRWLTDTSWLFLAGGAIFIVLIYPCLWAEVKLKDRQQAKASFKDTP